MGESGAEFCHVVAVLDVLSCEEVELVEILLIRADNDVPLGLFYVEDGFKHDSGAFLDELTHGVKVCGVVDAGGEDALAVLAF